MSLRHGGRILGHTAFSSNKARNHSSLGLVLFGSLIFVLAQSGSLFAAAINYGDFTGNTVKYLGVTEDAATVGDTPPLFGAPTVSADSLNFTPVGFSASAAGVNGIDITDGNLKFMVEGKPGFSLPLISISEAGDTSLLGIAALGSQTTFTSVSMRGVLTINKVDGAGINALTVPITMAFSPSGGTFGLGTDGNGGPLFNSAWAGNVVVNIKQALIDNGIPFIGGATKITVNFDNTLVAISTAGTSALIAKKGAGSIIITTPGNPTGNTPEPTAALLVLFGLAAASGLRCSRR